MTESSANPALPAVFTTLADHACRLGFDDLPEAVVRRVDAVLMDLIGSTWVVLGGPGSRALWRYASAMNSTPQATLWGTSRQVAVAEAATVNGALGYEAEFDDGNTLGGHWGSSSIPAILALAERDGACARDVTVAIVVAYEIGNRVSRLVSKGLLERGIHFPGTMGAVAAIAGAGRLLGLDRDTLAAALGHAALSPIAPYLPGHVGADTKNLYSGWPNHCGIHFTALAQAGYLGAADLLEGRDGLAAALGRQGAPGQLAAEALDGLGARWAISQTYFKAYPCCRWLQAPVRGVIELMRANTIDAIDIASVRVRGPRFLAMYAEGEPCMRPIQGKYSLMYCVGAAAARGALGQDEFSADALDDARIRGVSQRVEFCVDAVLEAQFPLRYETVVEVRLRDGRLFESRDTPPWGPEQPPELDELAGKFMPIMRAACGDDTAGAWLAWFRGGLQADPSLRNFFDLLRRSAVADAP